MTWPEVREELSRGRTTVVVPFGAVEQHGPHLPLGTDAIFGDEIGLAVAERLDAFLAPTVRVGFSPHHMAFAGTLTVDEETFRVSGRSRGTASGGSSSFPCTAATSAPWAPPSPGWPRSMESR